MDFLYLFLAALFLIAAGFGLGCYYKAYVVSELIKERDALKLLATKLTGKL